MDEKKYVGFVIRSLSRVIGREADKYAGKKYLESLTGTNGWIIGYLANHSDRQIFQRDLEIAFSSRRSTVSRIVTLMEQKGLVERHEIEDDRRLRHLVLTEKAKEIHKKIESEFEELDARLTDGISDEEIATFLRVSEKMISNLGGCTSKRS